MYSQEQKQRADARSVSITADMQSKHSTVQTYAFEDNRPETVAQRRCLSYMEQSTRNAPQIFGPAPVQRVNDTGLPDNLKTGIENLSGYALDDVKVHYNSPKPAQLQAHAYAQGTDIHLASGQEKHLPHEAWHVVQQKQGRVSPTTQLNGNVNVNDSASLEQEADVMGTKALQRAAKKEDQPTNKALGTPLIQKMSIFQGLEFGTNGPLQPAPSGTVLQMVKIDVTYNGGQGRLISSLGYLAEKDQAWYDSFPADAWPAIFNAVDAIIAPIPADAISIATIKQRVATAQANFDNTGFAQADAGKQQAAIQGGYAEMQELIARISDPEFESSNQGFEKGKYAGLIASTNAEVLGALHHGTTLWREYWQPFSAIAGGVKAANGALVAQIMNLFKWLYPLDRNLVKGLNDINGIQTNLKILLGAKIQELRARGGGVAALPEEALIDHDPPQNIKGQLLGKKSEIVTSRLGALKSGEKSEGRGLESEMSQASGVRFVAGHLVAASIGGKFAAYNLTPMTNTFNTSDPGMQPAEAAARLRLVNQGKVIHYKTTVTYNNAAREDWRAFLPATIRIELSDMAPKLGGDPSDIRDYQVKSNTAVFTPPIGTQI